MAKGISDLRFSFAQWSSTTIVETPLALIRSFLTPRFARNSGPIRSTLWAFDGLDLSTVPSGLDPTFSFSRDAADVHTIKAGLKTTGYLAFDASTLPHLFRSGFQLVARFHVRLEADGAIVARPVFRMNFDGQPADHVMSMDVGSTGIRLALRAIDQPRGPQLQFFQVNSETKRQLPSDLLLIKDAACSLRDRPAEFLGPIRLGQTEATWLLGFPQAEETGLPAGAMASPPAAQLLHIGHARQVEWDDDVAPYCLIWLTLIHCFNRLAAADPSRWQRVDPPLPESLILTLPGLSRDRIPKLKTVLQHALRDCRDATTLIPGWHPAREKIHLVHQADAAAADAIFRSPKSGGLGPSPVDEPHGFLSFHFGATSCEATVLRFVHRRENGSVFPHIDIEDRFHLGVGGNDMDALFADLLLNQAASIADAVTSDNPVGFFDDSTTHPEATSGQPRRDRRMGKQLAHLARGVKEMLSDACYGRELNEHPHIAAIHPPAPGQALLDQLYDMMERADAAPDAMREAIKRTRETLESAISETEFQLSYDAESTGLRFSALLNDPRFTEFLETTCVDFLGRAVQASSKLEAGKLSIVLTGGMVAFPLVQETILDTLVRHSLTADVGFPNRAADPGLLRQSVTLGGAFLATSMATPETLMLKHEHEVVLLCFDQRRGCPVLQRLLKRHARYQARREGPALLSATVAGVRLRQTARAPEILRIAQVTDPIDWHDEPACLALAQQLSVQPEEFSLLFNETVEKDGPFQNDGDRTVHVNLSSWGDGAVRLFPQTKIGKDDTKSGHGPFRLFRIRKAKDRPQRPALSTFPF